MRLPPKHRQQSGSDNPEYAAFMAKLHISQQFQEPMGSVWAPVSRESQSALPRSSTHGIHDQPRPNRQGPNFQPNRPMTRYLCLGIQRSRDQVSVSPASPTTLMREVAEFTMTINHLDVLLDRVFLEFLAPEAARDPRRPDRHSVEEVFDLALRESRDPPANVPENVNGLAKSRSLKRA